MLCILTGSLQKREAGHISEQEKFRKDYYTEISLKVIKMMCKHLTDSDIKFVKDMVNEILV